jgi:hypothetical protein
VPVSGLSTGSPSRTFDVAIVHGICTSRHLALMHQAGVVSRRRDGAAVFYQVTDPEFVEICRTVCVRIASRIEAGEPLKRELLDFAVQR